MRWFAIQNVVGSRNLLSLLFLSVFAGITYPAHAEVDIYIPDVPDYQWYGGCTGTGSGIIMGYWDRHGFPNFYTGPTGGGLAPLDSVNDYELEVFNFGIRAFWASRGGLDGRPTNRIGHIEDYWTYYSPANAWPFSYESTAPDPHKTAGRPEHTPECIGDFIGLSQNKWTNMNNECDGNIDSYAFVFWDNSGHKRTNYIPPLQGGIPVKDIPSGWMAWTKYRGYLANVFSQLTDFNTNVPPGRGFTFNDLKREINAGYPILFYQQNFSGFFRYLTNPVVMPKANPPIHAGVIVGYYEGDDGSQWVRFRSMWGDGDNFAPWDASYWLPSLYLPARGVCGYHPLPKITSLVRNTNATVTLCWHGPAGQLTDNLTGVTTNLHYYVIERSLTLKPPNFAAITTPSFEHTATVPDPRTNSVFYRVKLLGP